MQPLLARVRNGRLILDEPTDLPEGDVVELVRADEMDDDDRARLDAALEVSIAQAQSGNLIEADEVLAKLLARG